MSGIQLLYDRSWISEAVFGPIGTDTDRLGVAGRRYLERVALSRRGIVVVPFTPHDVCYARRPPVTAEAAAVLKQAHARYARAQELTCLPVVHASASAKVDNLLAELERLRPAANAGPGTGHWEPNQVTLIVGEQPSQTSDARLPFVEPSLKRGGCAEWLALQLEAGGVPERGLYWINARDPGQRWADPEFLDELRPRRVVALGEVAAQWCGVVARCWRPSRRRAPRTRSTGSGSTTASPTPSSTC